MKVLVVHVQQLGRVVRLGALGTPQSDVGVLLLKKVISMCQCCIIIIIIIVVN